MRRPNLTQSQRPTEHMFPRKRGRNKKRRVQVLPYFRNPYPVHMFSRLCPSGRLSQIYIHVGIAMWNLQLGLILLVLFDS
jgi:hypothetical protein